MTTRGARITGHTVILDNMGFSGLTHPLACQVKYRPLDCPVTKALNAGRYEGGGGKGEYQVVLDHEGYALLRANFDLDTCWEITDLLDAYADEVGIVKARGGVSAWVLSRRGDNGERIGS